MNKEMVVREPAELITLAVEKGANLSELEKVLELQERYNATKAKNIYCDSFADVQANIQAVKRNCSNPQTKSKYADLSSVIESSKPIYTKGGFSVIFYEMDISTLEHIRICADVLHKAGHKETYHIDIPLDGKGLQGNANMTKIHGKASAISYARRYLMCMIWNIPTEDNDGVDQTTVEYITEEQYSRLIDHINDQGLKEENVCKFLGVTDLKKLPLKDLPKAMRVKKAVQK